MANRSYLPATVLVFTFASTLCLAESPLLQGASAGAESTKPIPGSTQSPTAGPPAGAGESTRDPVGEARELYSKGNFDAAITKYKQLLGERPKSPDAYAGLIRAYLKEKKLDQAVQTADEGLSATDSPRVRVAYAEVLFRQGSIDRAETEWAKAINAGFPEARAYLGLAKVRTARAMYQSAAAMAARAHDLDPNDPEIEEFWIETLPRSKKIKFLEDKLASWKDGSDDQRQSTMKYVEYLKEQQKTGYRRCSLVNGTVPAIIPFTMLLGEDTFFSGWGVPIFSNGRKSVLRLDTGAHGILLGRKAAERAGIVRVASTKVGGIGDKQASDGYIGFANSIQIGNLVFQDCPVQVLEGRSVLGDDGLIGSDFFRDFLIDIDYSSASLKLSALPLRPSEKAEVGSAGTAANKDGAQSAQAPTVAEQPEPVLRDAYIAPEMETFSRVFLVGGDLLVPTSIGDVSNKLFLLDTGAFNNVISPAAAREVTKVYGDSNTIVKGIRGRVNDVHGANKVFLQFGHLRQENRDMVVFDTSSLSDEIGTEVSGMLGFEMLELLDIRIDYRDALVDFTYHPR
jgi:tetratricopeptide (TPR) repeat protein